MRKLIASLAILSTTILISVAQSAPLQLPTMTESEIAKLKPQPGMVVFNTTENAISYYSNQGWFLLSGECSPKVQSPEIKSALIKDGTLTVVFTPAQQGIEYYIEDQYQRISYKATTSPATISLTDYKEKINFITIRAEGKCGKAAPSGLFKIEDEK